jgi:hypothetical protein
MALSSNPFAATPDTVPDGTFVGALLESDAPSPPPPHPDMDMRAAHAMGAKARFLIILDLPIG